MNIWFGTGENAELSNLAHRPFVGNDKRTYQSVEHAYQTWKSGTFDDVYYKPWKHGSKFIGRKRANFDTNIDIMYRIMLRSFASNPEVAKLLVATGDVILTHIQDRGIWKTQFPALLMRIRNELK